MVCPYSLQNVTDDNIVADDGQLNEKPAQLHPKPRSTNITPAKALQLAKSSCPAFSSSCPFVGVHDAEGMRKALSSLPPSHLSSSSTTNISSSTKSVVSTSATASVSSGSIDGDRDREFEDGEGIDLPINDNVEISETLRVALQHVHVISQTLHSSSSSNIATDSTTQEQHSTRAISPMTVDLRDSQKYEIEGGCPFKTLYIQKNRDLEDLSSVTESITFVQAMESFSLSAIIANMLTQQEQSISDQLQLSEIEGKVPPTTSKLSAESTISKSSIKNERSYSISTALKTGTEVSHNAAESVHFVKEFIKGNIDQSLYTQLIYNLYFVYDTLESCLDEYAPEHFSALYFPKELGRRESLSDDVEFFIGMDWESDARYTPFRATVEYQNRLRWICQKEPLLLLSHAYTRYLGDLSGGKVLARVARKSLNLSRDNPDGLRFYYFEDIESEKKFKDDYRIALDELNLTSDQVERLVAEANVAFALNMRIFEELDVLDHVDGASVRPFEEATVYYEDCIRNQEMNKREHYEESDAKCPFGFVGPNPHGDDGHVSSDSSKVADITVSKGKGMTHSAGERCPWPFIFFHDPATGFRDYQTWIVIGLGLCWCWSLMAESCSEMKYDVSTMGAENMNDVDIDKEWDIMAMVYQ